MNNKKAVHLSIVNIEGAIKKIYKTFLRGQELQSEIAALQKRFTQFKQANSDAISQVCNSKEMISAFCYALMPIVGFVLDFFVLSHALTIICHEQNMPSVLKFIIPAFLIIVEIIISKYQTAQNRINPHQPWYIARSQYLVLFILVALSVIAVVYALQAHDPNLDNISFASFATGAIAFQIAILVFSVLLHLWLITNSEEIVEAYALCKIKFLYSRYQWAIRSAQRDIEMDVTPKFHKDAQVLIQMLNQFKRQFPNESVDFTESMPTALMQAINKAQGKQLFFLTKQPAA